MGTVTARTRRDGSRAYTAQIRLMRDGKTVFSAAQTFDSAKAARAWIDRKERELEKPGAIEAARNRGLTLGDAIGRYIQEMEDRAGKTKTQVLRAIKVSTLAEKACADIRSEDIVAWAREMALNRQPQTVGNYVSHLSAVFRLAGPAWGYPLDYAAMRSAAVAAQHFGLTARSGKRDRRPTLDEMDRIMRYYERHDRRKNAPPMRLLIAFAIFSTRRQAEIVRLRWEDLEDGRILVRDMKHPGEKIGNDVWCDLPPEAERLIRSMPRVEPEIFPFKSGTICSSFTRTCKVLGIENLNFHDFRHDGVSRLFEMGRTIPLAASVSGHRSWSSLKRYAHLRHVGDKYAGWPWLEVLAPAPDVAT